MWTGFAQLRSRLALLLVLILISVGRAQSQEKPEFAPVAADLARAIQALSRPSGARETRVLIVDFEESRAPTSQLGHVLATEFSDSLQQAGSGLVILTRDKLDEEIPRNNLPEGLLSYSSATKCYASKLGADIFVAGTFELRTAGGVLPVEAWRTEPLKRVFRQTDIVIPMTNSMMDLAVKLSPTVPPLAIHEAKVWVNPDHPPLADEEIIHFPAAKDAGYKEPSCLKCMSPPFSEDAVIFQGQGTIHLKIQILPDGSLSKISLIDGLPCGLTDEAFEAVEHWTLAPATSADGKPVAADIPAEVTFHLY